MSGLQTLPKHFKTADAEIVSGFDPPVIPFIPKPSTLKSKNSQQFNLCISATKKDNNYKFKVYIFSNGSPKDILEWEKTMQKIVKSKLVDKVEAYICNHIKKPNKLSIKNTAARLRDMN
eukprot:1103231-Ditylum_brightwellii.AAC.1